ncbi:MAG: hypothetical protein ACT4O0_10495 [Pseudonocardia sp.]
MLRNLGITAAASALLLLGAAGVAFAGDYDGDGDDDGDGHGHGGHDRESSYNTDCSSHESVEQTNDGDQTILGGNSNITDLNGPGGASADKIAICPSIGNNNHIG